MLKKVIVKKKNFFSIKNSNFVFLFLLLLFFLFSLSSCNFSSVTNEKLDCSSGSEGLKASFENHNYLFKENSDNIIKVFLYNKGVFDSKGILRLKYNTDLFNVKSYDYNTKSFVDNNNVLFSIEGKKPYNECLGDKKLFLFKIVPYKLPLSVNKFSQELSLDLCYKYGFNFSSNICVQKSFDINALGEDCTPKEQYFSGQGSPVYISKISKPEYSDNTVKFKIFFKNAYNGFITADKNVQNDLFEACNLNNNVKNYIYIKGFLDSYKINCENFDVVEGKTKLIELDDGEYFLECKVENVNLDSTRNMFLNLEVAYYYIDRSLDFATVTITK